MKRFILIFNLLSLTFLHGGIDSFAGEKEGGGCRSNSDCNAGLYCFEPKGSGASTC